MYQFIFSSIAIAMVLFVSGADVLRVAAQVMSSGSFQIQSDSINVNGGLGTSTNYRLESTGGEVATGQSTSTNYSLFAGYQQMQEVFISMTTAADVLMAPTLPGISGGTATGSTAVIVRTDSGAGYQLTIASSQNPAMQSATDSIADYVPVGASPDFVFTTDFADAHFGFTPEGTDVALRYQDTGGMCGVAGTDTLDRCYDGLTTLARVIAQSTDSNHPEGATTTLRFKVGLGGGLQVPTGIYVATTTLTALPL